MATKKSTNSAKARLAKPASGKLTAAQKTQLAAALRDLRQALAEFPPLMDKLALTLSDKAWKLQRQVEVISDKHQKALDDVAVKKILEKIKNEL